MRISVTGHYSIPDELVKQYFPDGNIPTPEQLWDVVFAEYHVGEFVDYYTDWRLEE